MLVSMIDLLDADPTTDAIAIMKHIAVIATIASFLILVSSYKCKKSKSLLTRALTEVSGRLLFEGDRNNPKSISKGFFQPNLF